MNRSLSTRVALAVCLFGATAWFYGQSSPGTGETNPISVLRDLLVMSPDECAQTLEKLPPDKRKIVEESLEEYRRYQPNQREILLRTLELRYYLKPLLAISPAQRADRLARIPDPVKSLVEKRLREWDRLSEATRTEFLANKTALQYFLRPDRGQLIQVVSHSSPPVPGAVLRSPVPYRTWQPLGNEQQRRMADHLNAFFDLNSEERERILRHLSDAERKSIERSLSEFRRLPPKQREDCIASFSRFAGMAPAEQNLFLNNASHWSDMTPDERQAWRDLVGKLPPFPPDDDGPPAPPDFGR